MTLHLGGDIVVPIKDIIAIFDLETTKLSMVNREFLEIANEEGFIEEVAEDSAKTFIVAIIEHRTRIFLSPISSSTLLKRTNFIESLSFANSSKEQGGKDGTE